MHYEVIVVGIGAMGAAVLNELSRRGCRVLGIERFSVPNNCGSSAGETRLIRKAYAEHADYVPLLERAYGQWAMLEKQCGQRLLYPTGVVYIGPDQGELIGSTQRSARLHHLPIVDFPGDALHHRWPQFRLPSGYVAVEEPEAGFVMCERGITVLAAMATEQGAELLTDTPVQSWQVTDRGVAVATTKGTLHADRLVITAGSWSAGLLQLAALSLQVTHQALFWIRPERARDFALSRFPCWAIERSDMPGLLYGFPDDLPGVSRRGVKVGHHHPGPPCSPDEPRNPPSIAEAARVRECIAPFLPGLQGVTAGSAACMYTMSNDGHFIVDRHPACDSVVFAAGFSGHGFKFAPVIGELLADYVLEGGSELPADFLRVGARELA